MKMEVTSATIGSVDNWDGVGSSKDSETMVVNDEQRQKTEGQTLVLVLSKSSKIRLA